MSAVGVESLKKTAYAAAKNKQPILEVLQRQLALSFPTDRPLNILEVASGTGEHASLFLESIPTLAKYQPSEIDESMHESIGAWLEPFGDRVRPPLTLNMMDSSRSLEQLSGVFEEGSVDAIICINMIHISPFACTHGLFQVAERTLSSDGFVLTYGPYRVNGEMVESNMQFDASLQARNPEWGVRDLEAVEVAARACNLVLKDKVSMPANNLCLIFGKVNEESAGQT